LQGKCHTGPADAQHQGQKFVGGGQVIPVHPVVAHQQPAGETLFDRVTAVGQSCLTHLDHECLHEAQQMLMQRGTARRRAPEIVSPDP
jgi:hypothetical protein